MRKVEFDIMKGILIVMVVLGHTTIKLPLIDVFWFHMPAFFMITGYLSQRWVSFGDKMYLRRKTCQLLIPYLSYSVLLFLLIGYSPLWKYILKVLLGGTLNITPFSYPFWYINTLFVALVACGLIKTSWLGYPIVADSLIVNYYSFDELLGFPSTCSIRY